MRIISQGGHADLPYEEIALCMACEDIIARHNDKEYLMARYSSKEKAQKAMEMLRETYQYGKKVPVPKFDESGIDKEDDITLYNTRLLNDFFKGGTYIPIKVFLFPKDEDVEV